MNDDVTSSDIIQVEINWIPKPITSGHSFKNLDDVTATLTSALLDSRITWNMKIKHAKASYFTKLEMTKTDVLNKCKKVDYKRLKLKLNKEENLIYLHDTEFSFCIKILLYENWKRLILEPLSKQGNAKRKWKSLY